MKVLLIDDDFSISIQLRKILEKEGYVVDIANNGSSGLSLAFNNEYDIILLDINLPEMDGVSVCSSYRKAGKSTPIIFLTIKDEINNKIRSFTSGCDDYIIKPFSSKELILRMNAILKRSKIIQDECFTIEDLTVNLSNKEVYRGNKYIRLTRKEFLIIEYLFKNEGKVVSRDKIFDHVWDMNANANSNIVEVYINKLRKKIDFPGTRPLINNLIGMGYYIGKKRYC